MNVFFKCNVCQIGNGDDTIVGGKGNDMLNRKGGNDNINGGVGNDIIFEGTGYNKIQGGKEMIH